VDGWMHTIIIMRAYLLNALVAAVVFFFSIVLVPVAFFEAALADGALLPVAVEVVANELGVIELVADKARALVRPVAPLDRLRLNQPGSLRVFCQSV